MALPTYLNLSESVSRIREQCNLPAVKQERLLQHASEGHLQLFALVRKDVCALVQLKTQRGFTIPAGTFVPLTTELARRFIAGSPVSTSLFRADLLVGDWAAHLIAEDADDDINALLMRSPVDGKIMFEGAVCEPFCEADKEDGYIKKFFRAENSGIGWEIQTDDLRFRASEITSFIEEHNNQKPAAPAAKGGTAPATKKAGTNKKKWDDTRLEALWKESIMPGVTHDALAEKYGVKRQRIGALLARAKDVHKMSSPSPYSTAGLLVQANKSKRR